MGLGFYGNFFHAPGCGIEHVNFIVVAAREPEQFAVDTQIAHVGTAAARNSPVRLHCAGGEVDHADAPFSLWRPVDTGDTAVRDVKFGAVAAGIQAVRPQTGFDMADFYERISGGDSFRMAFTVEENVYNGTTTIQLRIKDIKFD